MRQKIRLSRNSNLNWRNDAIQFPRLLAEMMSTIEFTTRQREDLCETMDLEWSEVLELFDRADLVWQAVKLRLIVR